MRSLPFSFVLVKSKWDREPNEVALNINQDCAVMGIDKTFLDNDCHNAKAGTICEDPSGNFKNVSTHLFFTASALCTFCICSVAIIFNYSSFSSIALKLNYFCISSVAFNLNNFCISFVAFNFNYFCISAVTLTFNCHLDQCFAWKSEYALTQIIKKIVYNLLNCYGA